MACLSEQMWGRLEANLTSDTDKARSVYKRGVILCTECAPLWMEYAMFECREGRIQEARRLFQQGSSIRPLHVPLLEAWEAMEQTYGSEQERQKVIDLLQEAVV